VETVVQVVSSPVGLVDVDGRDALETLVRSAEKIHTRVMAVSHAPNAGCAAKVGHLVELAEAAQTGAENIWFDEERSIQVETKE